MIFDGKESPQKQLKVMSSGKLKKKKTNPKQLKELILSDSKKDSSMAK